MRKFCDEGCRASYREDRAVGLIYGGIALTSEQAAKIMSPDEIEEHEFIAYEPSDRSHLHGGTYVQVGWEDGCKALGICCYCAQEIKEGKR